YKLGAKRVTLSYELNRHQIQDLITAYEETNGGSPALEMIVYGRAPLLFTKYCPLKKMGLCGSCKSGAYELKDEYGEFPVLTHEDCSTTILNGKILNLLDEMPQIDGVEAFRLSFTIESAAEVKRVIDLAQQKLEGSTDKSAFNQKTDTRGHFNKEIL
ncbi:MAG: U32 family peptidase, partial [Clostridia bacterium]